MVSSYNTCVITLGMSSLIILFQSKKKKETLIETKFVDVYFL